MSKIRTVLGEIESSELGVTLTHEHILVDFIGADRFSRARYDRDEAYRVMLPYLREAREAGVRSFVECTPMYLGRDPLLAARLARASGLQILVNTGIYAAGEAEGKETPYVPGYGYELSAEELAGGWLKEWYEGIDGTEARPGFIKIGISAGPLGPISRKLVHAAALTSLRSGLAIASHTVKAVACLEALDLLEDLSVAPDRFIFVHAQGEEDVEKLVECGKRGCWISLDGIGRTSADRHLYLITRLLERDLEDRILLSHDAGWYRPGEPGGGQIRGFEFLTTEFVPGMIDSGIPRATIDHLLIHNPAAAFSLA